VSAPKSTGFLLADRPGAGYVARMTALPRPEVILTHESDLDGLLSGMLLQRLARKLFAADIPLEAYHYNMWKQRPLPEKAAWVADLSFEPRLDRSNWVILDHHATTAVPRQARLIHDPAKSAALLCYELCREAGLATPALDRLVHLSNVADLFLDDDADFELANDYASLVKVYNFWNLHALVEGEPDRLLDHPLLEVMAVKHRVEDPLGYEWSRANVRRLSDSVGFVDTVIGNVNRIVHRMLEQQATPHAVLATFFVKGNRTVIASFRSRDGSALKVAQLCQGGGHPNAAGATLPKHVQNVPDAIEYLRLLLDPPSRKDPPLNNLAAVFAAAEARR